MISIALAFLLAAAESAVPAPKANPGSWITTDDYPVEALRNEETGMVGFVLDVDSTGRVTGCWITSSSGSPTLDEATCDLLTARGTFEAARDERGRKIAGQYRSRVNWEIPEDAPMPFKSWSQTAQAVVSGAGKLESCTVVGKGEFPRGDGDFCTMLKTAPPEVLLMLRFTPGQASVPLVAQISFAVDGEPVPADYRAEGLTVTNLVRSQFEVDAKGNATDCTMVEGEGILASFPKPCETFLSARFEVDDQSTRAYPRKATFVIATAVKKEAAAAR